jgi:hypothetical protein
LEQTETTLRLDDLYRALATVEIKAEMEALMLKRSTK